MSARVLHKPSEPEEWLSDLALHLLDYCELPLETPVAIVGSVAEGFGNDGSDIDVLLVLDGDGEFVHRQHTSFRQRRVEVFARSRKWLKEFGRSLPNIRDPLGGFAMYDQVAHCHAVNGRAVLDEIRREYCVAWLRKATAAYFEGISRDWFEKAFLLNRMAQHRESVYAAREGARFAAKRWACAQGETYHSVKFLIRQLKRANLDRSILQDVRRTLTTSPGLCESSVDVFLSEVGSLVVHGLQLSGLADTFGAYSLQPDANVVSGLGQCLIGNDTTTLVVQDGHQAVHSHLSRSGQSVASTKADLRPVLGELHKAGIVAIRVSSGDWSRRCPLSSGSPRIGTRGVVQEASVGHYRIGLSQLASAWAALLASASMRENLKEDAIGAIRTRDWSTVDHALKALAIMDARILVCHRGLFPLPDDNELVSALDTLGWSDVTDLVVRIGDVEVAGPSQTVACFDLLATLERHIPAAVGLSVFEGYHWSTVRSHKVSRLVAKLLPMFHASGIELPPFLAEHASFYGENAKEQVISLTPKTLLKAWASNATTICETRSRGCESRVEESLLMVGHSKPAFQLHEVLAVPANETGVALWRRKSRRLRRLVIRCSEKRDAEPQATDGGREKRR